MASLDLKIHPASGMTFKPMDELAGAFEIAGTEGKPYGLMFSDPDGETHVYVLDSAGRERLLQILTGLTIPSIAMPA